MKPKSIIRMVLLIAIIMIIIEPMNILAKKNNTFITMKDEELIKQFRKALAVSFENDSTYIQNIEDPENRINAITLIKQLASMMDPENIKFQFTEDSIEILKNGYRIKINYIVQTNDTCTLVIESFQKNDTITRILKGLSQKSGKIETTRKTTLNSMKYRIFSKGNLEDEQCIEVNIVKENIILFSIWPPNIKNKKEASVIVKRLIKKLNRRGMF